MKNRRELIFGDEKFQFGDEVEELHDSSSDLNDYELLRQRMKDDGYLFLRSFHDVKKVKEAAAWTLNAVERKGGIKLGTKFIDGYISKKNESYNFFRETDIAHAKAILDVVNSKKTFNFFERFLGGEVITFDKRWLRCMAKGGNNHFHYDTVYLGRGTKNRYTMWTPITEIEINRGPLVICLGSHNNQKIKTTYGNTDTDKDLTEAVFSKNPRELIDNFGFKLATTHFNQGDVLIFGLYMMHASIPNRSNKYRISIDTRYQLAKEEKDERFFFGKDGTWLGNSYNKNIQYKSIEILRKEWGLNK